MKKVYDNCCGIDVHKKLMVACFIHGKEQEVREFGATTRELLELADWLPKADARWSPWKVPPPTGSPCTTSWNPPV